ncbi:MAG: hypothetical protein ACUBOA_11405 [Candidatus Loosdrechtia sp.]|uniref:hypothetical protein n=1 Tax=Candidatus Loosdrechtia sp. TaxID=3101272 RepID=UPI003A5E879C|nr:MAG: hypothetical protein QY305_00210 [Candidatus Jettenia sp. AMX2]
MVHYTCDMCGKPLLAEGDIRYVVKIEVYSAYDAMDDDINEEIEVEEEIEEFDDRGNPSDKLKDDEYRSFRFDLCTKCHKKYLHDPLFLKPWHKTRFSEN